MAIEAFPPLESADPDGLLAIGGDLEVESLLLAYRSGIFPWPLSEDILAWFSPPNRAVLFLDELHISRSLEKEIRRCNYRFTINQAFDDVIEACAEFKNRKHQRGTWITQEMQAAYKQFNRAGYAISFECWDGSILAGGGYGVLIDNKFAGESLFYRKANASKVAFYFMVQYLRRLGIEWIDCQVLNSLTESLGARDIPRDAFLKLLTHQ